MVAWGWGGKKLQMGMRKHGNDEYLHYLDHTVDLMSIHPYENLSN